MDPNHGYGFTPTTHNDTYAAIDPERLNLSGKKVLITGAARGIGREIALSYAKAGASAIGILDLLDSTPVEKELLEAAKAAGRPTPDVASLRVDVTSATSVARAVQILRSKFGSLDVLITNAGYLTPYTSLGDSDPDKWWRSWEVNVKGVYLMTRYFLPLVLKSQDKTIIVLSSVGAHHTMPGVSAYETTKLAVLKINNYLNTEYGSQGLLAYAVAPGGVRTDMANGFPSEFHHLLSDTPQMVADTMTFLTQTRLEWLAGRYVDSRWDMPELLGKKDSIIKGNLLTIQMRV
ncbi:short chain dehydrogenase reductase [Tothia fuscella]|uniref:Short chain dehydrogenase reductase n=1 Tax=Tothia fuscella TaxID=1048955 RepID=A0A9P4NNF0_9PEZI|nr:short chain dehydrogenase reductase [Tothia fuscella]